MNIHRQKYGFYRYPLGVKQVLKLFFVLESMRKYIMMALCGTGMFHINGIKCQIVHDSTTSLVFSKLADGRDTDWSESERRLDKKTGIVYGVARDSGHLFLLLRFTNPLMIQKILMSGMEVYIDTKGNRNRTTAVHFPIADQKGRWKPGMASHDSTRILGMRNGMELRGFRDSVNGFFFTTDLHGIRVMMNIDLAGCLIYELEVNRDALMELNVKRYKVGVRIFALEDPALMGGPPMGGPPPGSGPPPDGPPPGGPPPDGMMPGMGGGKEDALYEEVRLWIQGM